MITNHDLIRNAMSDLDDPDGGTWSPYDIARYAQEAIEEYARRTESYHDVSNVSEVRAFGVITFKTNPTASITTLTIGGVSVIGATIVPATTVDATAVLVRDAINLDGVYAAVVNGATVTIAAPVGVGYGGNGRVIAVNAGVIGSVILSPFTGGSVLTKIPILVGTNTYQLDPRIIRVKDGYLETSKRTVFPQSVNHFLYNYDPTKNGPVNAFSVDAKYGKIVFIETPDKAETIDLGVVRYPLNKISWEMPTMVVEIEKGFESVLYSGIMYHAYKKLRNGMPVNVNLSQFYQSEFINKIKEVMWDTDKEWASETKGAFVTSGSGRN